MEGLDLLKIGEAIKIRRIKRRIHQTKLAEQLGISQTHLSNAENGRVMLSLKALLKLKRIFDCTLDELVDPCLLYTSVKVKIWNMLNADIRLKLLTANP